MSVSWHIIVFYDCDFASVFFFKQKMAYEMRISDWSLDVCSSDLPGVLREPGDDRAEDVDHQGYLDQGLLADQVRELAPQRCGRRHRQQRGGHDPGDRKSVV